MSLFILQSKIDITNSPNRLVSIYLAIYAKSDIIINVISDIGIQDYNSICFVNIVSLFINKIGLITFSVNHRYGIIIRLIWR